MKKTKYMVSKNYNLFKECDNLIYGSRPYYSNWIDVSNEWNFLKPKILYETNNILNLQYFITTHPNSLDFLLPILDVEINTVKMEIINNVMQEMAKMTSKSKKNGIFSLMLYFIIIIGLL